ncbi:MAG: hypothetical protein OEY79_04940 [Anaplasmataceae bacterium]|nr:hypothetical protein [Anaplasmataceae bacterium]
MTIKKNTEIRWGRVAVVGLIAGGSAAVIIYLIAKKMTAEEDQQLTTPTILETTTAITATTGLSRPTTQGYANNLQKALEDSWKIFQHHIVCFYQQCMRKEPLYKLNKTTPAEKCSGLFPGAQGGCNTDKAQANLFDRSEYPSNLITVCCNGIKAAYDKTQLALN